MQPPLGLDARLGASLELEAREVDAVEVDVDGGVLPLARLRFCGLNESVVVVEIDGATASDRYSDLLVGSKSLLPDQQGPVARDGVLVLPARPPVVLGGRVHCLEVLCAGLHAVDLEEDER